MPQCNLTLRCDAKVGCFLGVDIDDAQLQKASENIEFAELGHRIHLLKASSMGEKPRRTSETLGFKSMFSSESSRRWSSSVCCGTWY